MKLEVYVVDAVHGRPVDGLAVRLECRRLDGWRVAWHGVTGANGRVQCVSETQESQGESRLVLESARYFATLGIRVFYRRIVVDLAAGQGDRDQELSLVVAPHSYLVCAVD